MKQVLPDQFKGIIKDAVCFSDPILAVDYVSDLYNKLVKKLKEVASDNVEFEHNITYPYVGIVIDDNSGMCGAYGTTISHPDILYDYYKEQFKVIVEEHKTLIWIGLSDYLMSLVFIDEDLFNSVSMNKNVCLPHLPCMKRIQNGLNGLHNANKVRPLSLFHGERIGYSLNRLHHYCGTDAKYFQNSVIFVNYNIYVDLFIEYSKAQIDLGHYQELVGPGIVYNKSDGWKKENKFFKPQIPAYHLVGKNKNGITLVNFNVGPSNVKTITDHIAVLRSSRWIMLGHCAGLRQENKIGDYVMAHNYSRHDYVLDSYIPKDVPIPSSSNLLKLFAEEVERYKDKVYMGTVVTTADRNWELNSSMIEQFVNAKAIAIDMESATIATNAFRFGVESIAFLCISDMPLHGAPKLRSMAKEFYTTKVHDHFNICMSATSKALLTHVSSKNDSYYSYCKSTSTPFR